MDRSGNHVLRIGLIGPLVSEAVETAGAYAGTKTIETVPEPLPVIHDQGRVPDVEDGVAVRRTGHSNTYVEVLRNLESCFAALAVFVLERCELVDAQGVEAREHRFVLHDPLHSVMISDDNLRAALESLLAIFGICHGHG